MSGRSPFTLVPLNYLASWVLHTLSWRLPPEIKFPLSTPATLACAVLLVFSLFRMSGAGWRSFCAGFVLLLPLVAFQTAGLLGDRLGSPSVIADKVEAPSGSAVIYSLLVPGMPDNSQVICVQRSLLSGCETVDAWQTQSPCKDVLPVYLKAYMDGQLAGMRRESSPASPLRRKCG